MRKLVCRRHGWTDGGVEKDKLAGGDGHAQRKNITNASSHVSIEVKQWTGDRGFEGQFNSGLVVFSCFSGQKGTAYKKVLK